MFEAEDWAPFIMPTRVNVCMPSKESQGRKFLELCLFATRRLLSCTLCDERCADDLTCKIIMTIFAIFCWCLITRSFYFSSLSWNIISPHSLKSLNRKMNPAGSGSSSLEGTAFCVLLLYSPPQSSASPQSLDHQTLLVCSFPVLGPGGQGASLPSTSCSTWQRMKAWWIYSTACESCAPKG